MITSKKPKNTIKRIARLLIGKWIVSVKAYPMARILITFLLMFIIIIGDYSKSANANQDMKPIEDFSLQLLG